MTDSTPRRRHSPAVYRRRRLVLLLVVLAVVAAVVLAFWRPWEAAADTAPSAVVSGSAEPSTDARDASDAPSASATPGAEAGTETPREVDPEASDLMSCSAASTTVAAMTDKETYGAEEQPQLSISLTNTGDEACLMNVGTATQAFTISSGADTWWRSTDCQSEPSDQVVQIDPGQSVSSVTPIVWDRTRSSVDTCDSERPSAPAGYFNLSVEIGGLSAQQDRQFVLQ